MAEEAGSRVTKGVLIMVDPTHPLFLPKRGCKLLKTKNGSAEKRGRREQEAASC